MSSPLLAGKAAVEQAKDTKSTHWRNIFVLEFPEKNEQTTKILNLNEEIRFAFQKLLKTVNRNEILLALLAMWNRSQLVFLYWSQR